MEQRTEQQRRVECYVDDVLSGRIPSCRTIILACRRFQGDLSNPNLFVDWNVLVNFDNFAKRFNHYKGPLSGTPFFMADWQLALATCILCIKVKATGIRKYRQADIEVPRKNGKTFFVAILALWLLLFDGESGPEVYTAAVDQKQARLCYDAAETLVMRSIFRPMVKKYNWGIKVPKSVGVFKPLSKDTENKDGLNIFGAICDECHAWANTKMMDVIKTGTGARSQPLIIRISTAGTDMSVPYYRDIQDYIKELEGSLPLEDDHFFWLYSPDKDDDWEDEEVWKKLNPNLGVSLSWDYMRSTYQESKTRGGSFVAAFKTKNLNMWVDAPDYWIEDEVVGANNAPFDESLLKGEECYVGIDLAAVRDITATALYFPKFNVVKFLFVVPEGKLANKDEERGRVDYRLWHELGWLDLCPGDQLDDDWYLTYLFDHLEQYKIRCIAYDPWRMYNIKSKFGKYASAAMEYQQNVRYLSPPTFEVERKVYNHEFNFLNNPVIRWMFSNVVIWRDLNHNALRLDKAKSRNKVDGVAALVDAVGGYLTKTANNKQAYHDHSLRSIKL